MGEGLGARSEGKVGDRESEGGVIFRHSLVLSEETACFTRGRVRGILPNRHLLRRFGPRTVYTYYLCNHSGEVHTREEEKAVAGAAFIMADEKTDEKKDDATGKGCDGGDGLNLSRSALADLEGAEPTPEDLAEALAYLAIAIEQVRGTCVCVRVVYMSG